MGIFKTKETKGFKFFQEIDKDESLYAPNSTESYNVEWVLLKTTQEESLMLWREQALVREGFVKEGNSIDIPTLFFKIYNSKSSEKRLQKDTAFGMLVNEKDIVNETYKILPTKCGFDEKYRLVDLFDFLDSKEDGGYRVSDNLEKSDEFRFKFLKNPFKRMFIQKVNYLLDNKSTLFKDLKLTDKEIIESIMGMNVDFMKMFNEYDFQYHIPKVIIKEEDGFVAISNKLAEKKAVVIMILKLLCFDVCILSSDQTAGFLELTINEESYQTFYEENLPDSAKPKKKGIFGF